MKALSYCPKVLWPPHRACCKLLASVWLIVCSPVVRASESFVATTGAAVPGGVAPRFAWWEGDLLGMSSRKVFALTSDLVVMCYARVDGGGCKVAAGAFNSTAHNRGQIAESSRNASDASSIARDPRLLPSLPWGDPRLFEDGGNVTRIEAERLAKDRFVVCFQRSDAHRQQSIACSVGILTVEAPELEGSEEVLRLQEFGQPLELGFGHLIAVSVIEAGKRFAVCHRDHKAVAKSNPMAMACNWAEVHVAEDAAGSGAVLHWTDDTALEILPASVERS